MSLESGKPRPANSRPCNCNCPRNGLRAVQLHLRIHLHKTEMMFIPQRIRLMSYRQMSKESRTAANRTQLVFILAPWKFRSQPATGDLQRVGTKCHAQAQSTHSRRRAARNRLSSSKTKLVDQEMSNMLCKELISKLRNHASHMHFCVLLACLPCLCWCVRKQQFCRSQLWLRPRSSPKP